MAATASAANLVPNSSFECGPGRGWMYFGGVDRGGNSGSMSDRLSTTNFHGTRSFEVSSRLLSRAIWLDAGTYTLSFYCRAPSALTVNYNIMNAASLVTTPSASSSATNGWQRFSTTFTASSNYFYFVKLYHISSTLFPLVDAVQVETGAVATAYSPMNQVEMGLDTAEGNNLLMAGDTKEFRLRFWNDGAATNATGQYMIYDFLNRIMASNSISQTVAASNSTVTVSLPATNGWLRIVSRLYESNDSSDETSVAVFPYAASTARNTNGFLGTHPNYFSAMVNRERRSGFAFGRDLSPAAGVRWTTVEPTSNNFVWNDATMTQFSTNNLEPICNLTTGLDGQWPTWATNGDGSACIECYTNYVFKTVQRYSVAPYNVHYWETLNEPQNYSTNPIFNTTVTGISNLAVLMDWTVKAIRDADPAAYILAFGGVNSASQHAYPVWTNLQATTKSNIDGLSCHLYPVDMADDPNLQDVDVHYASPNEWGATFTGIKPMWNTESGSWSAGGFKGLNSMVKGNYNLTTAPALEASRIEAQARHQAQVDRNVRVCLRSLGCGIRFVNYWSKYFNDALLDTSTVDPTVMEYNGAERPAGVAVLMANQFAGLGFGRFTNANATGVMELYQFTNTLGCSIVAFNYDRSMITLTTTNANIALYDCMGNMIQTNSTSLLINRTPRYLVSGSLTQSQLSNTVKYATSAATLDTVPPNVSFDIAPSGNWDGSTTFKLAKWSGHDENKLLWTTAGPATNIVYKWHLDGDAYTAYSASNHAWLPTLANGNHTLYVTAQDSIGNNSEFSYAFSNAVVSAETNGTTINSTRLNIGTIRAAP